MNQRRKIIITSGYFNPLHRGHLNLFREAKAMGDLLVVIVNNDAQVAVKGSSPFMPETERLEIVRALRDVDEVFLSLDKDGSVALSLRDAALKFPGDLHFAKGGDRNADNLPESEKKICAEFGIKIISGVGGQKVQSSSWLIGKVAENNG